MRTMASAMPSGFSASAKCAISVMIKAIQDAKLHAPLDLYLKVNSGMNRLGFQPERVHTVWQQLRALKNVGEMTLMALR